MKLYSVYFVALCGLVLFKTAEPTNFKGSIDADDGILFYANVFPFSHQKLNSTPFESRKVNGEQDCIALCTESPRCRSLNFKLVPEANGKFNCDLLDTDKFSSSEVFLNTTLEFYHYSMTVSVSDA